MIDYAKHRARPWTLVAASVAGIVAGACMVAAHAQAPATATTPQAAATSVRCVALELYIRSSDAKANESVAAIREYLADQRGVRLRSYDVDQDAEGLSRLRTISAAYKLGDPELPLVYGLNTTTSSIAPGDVWRARLTELLRMEVFTRRGCPRCARAKEYLPSFRRKYPGIQVEIYDVVSDPKSNQRFAELAARNRVGGASYPGFWICERLLIGFDNEKAMAGRLDEVLSRWTVQCRLAAIGRRDGRLGVTERLAERGLDRSLWNNQLRLASLSLDAAVQEEADSRALPLPLPEENPDGPLPGAAPLPLPGDSGEMGTAEGSGNGDAEAMDIPWLGRFSVREMGMPLFTLTIGLIDGFNPCAMWVLLFLLSVLVNLHDRWKIFAVAGTFVLISGLAYFAFMAAWLNVLLLVGFLRWVQVSLALLAIFVGSVHIKDYFAFKKGISLSIPESAKPRIYERVRRIVTAENLTAAIIGAVVLAVLVNIIELLCTAGLPALYTQILSQQGYPSWERYAYLALYIVAYMFDDSLMVGIVVVTRGRHKLQETEGRWLKLVSGVVILVLGLILLFKPQWLEQ